MTHDLLGGRRLARNVVWNLLGQGLPMLVALACIPPLIARLGNERFGILSIAWMLVGYFSLLDFGLGWALTRAVAQKLGTGDATGIPGVVRPALALMAILSLVGGLLLGAIAPWLATGVLDITPGLHDEAIAALVIMALSLPAVVLGAGLRGILEAHQRFVGINVLRATQGCVNFLAPLAVACWTPHLGWVVAVVAATRWITCGVLALMVRRTIPAPVTAWRCADAWPLLRLGGWMTVGNVVEPLIIYCDRMIAAVLLPMTVIPFYAVPFDLVSRILVAPAAVCAVVFPALSAALAGDPQRVGRILRGGMWANLALVGPVCLALGLFAPGFLHLWLGASFAQESATILRVLALGLLFNTLGTVPFSALQAAGRAKLVAQIQLVELAIYIPALLLTVSWLGLTGVAVAWMVRAGVDATVLLLLVRHLPLKAATT